jgi:glucuronosyltransferase
MFSIIFSFNFPSDRYRSYEESLNNISLALLNGHFSTGSALRPYLPNMIEVGGLQVHSTPSPLPEVIVVLSLKLMTVEDKLSFFE